ncbi:MAG: hypothetical protein ACJ76N_12685 [Thermoanaerobaculia bacterium]
MARIKALRPRVYTERDAQADPPTKPDGYLQKIVKYIPAEIVAAYVALADLVPPKLEDNKPLDNPTLWVIYWILLVLTPLYTWFFTQEANKPKPVFQTVVAPIAFTAWVFAIGGPFAKLKSDWDQPAIGTIVLIVVLLLIPLAERIFIPPPPPPGGGGGV